MSKPKADLAADALQPVTPPAAEPLPKQRTPEEQAAKDARVAARAAARESGNVPPPRPTQEEVQAAVKAPPSHKSLLKDIGDVCAKLKQHPARPELQTALRKLVAAKAAIERDEDYKPAPVAAPAPKW